MPLTLVVWSARPIHPLMRVLVRPQGDDAGHHRGKIAGREPDHRIVGLNEVTTTSPTSPSATGSPVPGRTISRIIVLVDDHALLSTSLS